MKTYQTRFIRKIGAETWERTNVIISNFALKCAGYESKTITQTPDTSDYQFLESLKIRQKQL